jgi:cytochrome P450
MDIRLIVSHVKREFEKGLNLLAVVPAPRIFARRPVSVRNYLQERLRPFFTEHLDAGDDVSDLIKGRAALDRRLGFPDDELGITEFTMPWVGITNTVPALFWLIAHVFSDPDVVARIRAEMAAIVTVAEAEGPPTATTTRTAKVDMTRLDDGCPLLVSCHRESLRVHSDQSYNRRVMSDTTLRDPDTGREYLLRKGVHVQWTSVVPHRVPSVWGDGGEVNGNGNSGDDSGGGGGDDGTGFRADRFVAAASPEVEKARQGANIPFGGGKHLCPGRNFARAELLGFVGALALGFELDGVAVPATRPANVGSGFEAPVWGDVSPAVTIKRRKGWEDVEWVFEFGLTPNR